MMSNARRVVRGGSWSSSRANVRATNRDRDTFDLRNGRIGIRLACASPI